MFVFFYWKLFQYKGYVPGGEEPAEFPGAAMWEVGGELIRCGRTTLLHHLGHAHHAAWALEEFTYILSTKTPGHRTCPKGLCSLHKQVWDSIFSSFFCPCFFVWVRNNESTLLQYRWNDLRLEIGQRHMIIVFRRWYLVVLYF